ncbi:hypothetical protein VL21_16625 [Stenotrophomonas maltophilia]|jgi:hypothetical protein|nr:hypothetical protein B7H26_06590 [Stenotrophomonas maltophilia]KOO75951.1 hypothetical protein VL21_16625 [Stenotrophomonas maltophilia]
MMNRTPSHGHLRPDPVDLRDPSDLLFEANGQRDPLLQALYTESLVNRRDVDTIDRLLDAHRLAYGEPEQVAYAQQRDVLHDRPLPLVSSDWCAEDADLQRYLEEHRAWNPVTQRERELQDRLGVGSA